LTSGNVFSWLKYGKAPAAASRAVVLFDMSFGVQFHSENSG
jgi:imidazoleglycerol phosphate synthase glutamine amidotransferase subunit HisH